MEEWVRYYNQFKGEFKEQAHFQTRNVGVCKRRQNQFSSSERRGKSIAPLQGRCSVSIDKNYFTLLSVIYRFQGCEIAPLESVSDNRVGVLQTIDSAPLKHDFLLLSQYLKTCLKIQEKYPKHVNSLLLKCLNTV